MHRIISILTEIKNFMENITFFPDVPGVYFFKNTRAAIIYIGKAKSLKKRVASYFKKQNTDWKINALLSETESVDYLVTKTETEALLLEADLVKKYQPKFNVLLKSGQPFLYIFISQTDAPVLKLVRTKTVSGHYFGPFIHKQQARKMFEYVVNTFKLFHCNKTIANGCLDYHIGRCAGTCLSTFDKSGYATRVALAIEALEQNKKAFLHRLEREIKLSIQNMEYEKARNLHTYRETIDVIFSSLALKFSPEKYGQDLLINALEKLPLDYEKTSLRLQEVFNLPKPPITIDCFDISHFQSSALVGSCVRFSYGIPEKNSFRRFKIKTLTQQNDYAALHEVVKRRYKNQEEKPDLVLIDGGKGQRNAVKELLGDTPCLSLAKREEIIYSDNHPEGYPLDVRMADGKLLICLRNYAHHFAIHYHRSLRSKGTS